MRIRFPFSFPFLADCIIFSKVTEENDDVDNDDASNW